MALQNPHSMRSLFISFIQDKEKKYGVRNVFSEVESDLKKEFPQFFQTPKARANALKAYSSALGAVRKVDLENNKEIKTKEHLQVPAVQKAINEDVKKNPRKFASGGKAGKRKTIVLTLENKDKVFFKLDDKVRDNLLEFIKYWHLQAMGQHNKAMATKSYFTAEMIEEYYRIFSQARDSKVSDEEKVKVYKDLEKGML